MLSERVRSQMWREDKIQKQLKEKGIQSFAALADIDTMPVSCAEQAVKILLEWACYGQNDAGILLGRSLLGHIPKQWLRKHMISVVREFFDYRDEWNYRRLMELVILLIPEEKDTFLALNANSDDSDLLEVVDDYRT